ncbi:TonB-dependent receptor [Niabella ginsengisoli]|uniref:Plug domain-containing protein n=1 Tax=Niabella ginsengisoli TaxID=522298 RepID=A0ABS9SNR7_9BACT|nr:Plug domain-containing protein [Niabella ginsengisoli]MCH5599997.1 Plug domain-containing protein [Niabella ginsengisoli]
MAASVTPVQSLYGAALQRLNSFSVADAIRYFSGVQLKDYGGIGGLKTINVRSMGTQHVGVFLDGVSVGNAQNGTVDLGKFSLDNIEAIELYNGHNPELLQPAKAFFASSGLYLQTTRPRFDSSQKKKLRAAFKTGSFGLANPSFLWQQKLTDNLSLSANAELVTAHGRYRFYKQEGLFDTTAIRQNADITAWRAEAALFKKINSSGEAFIKSYFYQSNRGLPGAIVENRFYNPQRLWDRNFLYTDLLKTHFLLNTYS